MNPNAYTNWKLYSNPYFSFEYPSELVPRTENAEDKITLYHSDGSDPPPFHMVIMKESLKSSSPTCFVSLEEYTQNAISNMTQLLQKQKFFTNFSVKAILDTKLCGKKSKEITYILDKLVTYQIWTVVGGFAFSLCFQSPEHVHTKLRERVCKHIVDSFFIREVNGWNEVVMEPYVIKGQNSKLYLPIGWEEVDTKSGAKFVSNQKTKDGPLMTLTIFHEKTNHKNPESFIGKKNTHKEVKLGQTYKALLVSKNSSSDFIWEVFSVIDGKKVHFIFQSKKNITMSVKILFIWRSILDLFQPFDSSKNDKHQIYLNLFYHFGLKFPTTYQPIPASGQTRVKLYHKFKGLTHHVWSSDPFTFCEPISEHNMVELWHSTYSPYYKLSPKVHDISVKGAIGKEVFLEVNNTQLLAWIFLKEGSIFSVSQRATDNDDDVEFFFIDYPLINYNEAKKIVDDLLPVSKTTPVSLQKNKSGWRTFFVILVFLLLVVVLSVVYIYCPPATACIDQFMEDVINQLRDHITKNINLVVPNKLTL